ncbi:hypothetical protein HD595_008978 [Nonomuraea roseoviolacea subsp. carminata]|uniref:Uncharacterized protein n=1 Tax=Nonomuraea roseoviolacea subsp. carminata TaxID=160689 RepID=A0ABT1KFT3_9ACTN|nr:hypothetical protein [Nonomuraea roseoviolacea subsp. carminata]
MPPGRGEPTSYLGSRAAVADNVTERAVPITRRPRVPLGVDPEAARARTRSRTRT